MCSSILQEILKLDWHIYVYKIFGPFTSPLEFYFWIQYTQNVFYIKVVKKFFNLINVIKNRTKFMKYYYDWK